MDGKFVLEVSGWAKPGNGWKIRVRGLGPSDWWKGVLQHPTAGVGFLQSLLEKTIWEGVWLYLDPTDSVRSRTASMEWNVPGKYGPHGELFFFLIQKEPATEQVGETFSPFFNADIRTPLFSADVLKKCAVIALHMIAEEGRDGDGCHARGLDWVAQRVQCGRVKAKLGRRMKMRLLPPLVKAMWATTRCTSSGCMGPVTRSFFPAGLGAGKGGTELSQGAGHAVPGNA